MWLRGQLPHPNPQLNETMGALFHGRALFMNTMGHCKESTAPGWMQRGAKRDNKEGQRGAKRCGAGMPTTSPALRKSSVSTERSIDSDVPGLGVHPPLLNEILVAEEEPKLQS
jgi:hypothetical protein